MLLKKNIQPYLVLIGFEAMPKLLDSTTLEVASSLAEEVDQLIDDDTNPIFDEWVKEYTLVPHLVYSKYYEGLQKLQHLKISPVIQQQAQILVSLIPPPVKYESTCSRSGK